MPSRRTLAAALESVADFREPRVSLEQYVTPPELAAHLCHLASMRGDLTDRPIVDLGCGTGMLALGARYVGAARIVGLDVDRETLETAVANERRLFETERIHWVAGDATDPPIRPAHATVVSNPPFGAQRGNRHADRRFLETISSLADVSYTIHNAGSLEFAEAFVDDRDGTLTDAFESEISIDHRFDFHTDDRSSIPVEAYRIDWTRAD